MELSLCPFGLSPGAAHNVGRWAWFCWGYVRSVVVLQVERASVCQGGLQKWSRTFSPAVAAIGVSWKSRDPPFLGGRLEDQDSWSANSPPLASYY